MRARSSPPAAFSQLVKWSIGSIKNKRRFFFKLFTFLRAKIAHNRARQKRRRRNDGTRKLHQRS